MSEEQTSKGQGARGKGQGTENEGQGDMSEVPRKALPKVDIFCDGACSGNPGPGGYGTILRYRDKEKELSGNERDTTNNRMELTAALEGLRQLNRPCKVFITTDSQYLVNGMTKWLAGWQKNGWKNGKKEPVANRDLWELLIEAASRHQVVWNWVRGHAGHAENERCDTLARNAISSMNSPD